MGGERIQRRLAAILADEARILEQLKTLLKEVFSPRTDEQSGRIVKTTGGRVLVEYGKPSR